MTLAGALKQLRSAGLPVLRTADAAAWLKTNPGNASAIMARLGRHGHVVRIKRGLWAFTDTDPLLTIPYLTAPFPSYVSLQSALYYHGMVSQIPETIYCVSLARTRQYTSSLAAVSIHHIPGSLFFGYESDEAGKVEMASPEKTLVDFLYLGPARSRLFAALPELTLPATFSQKRLNTMIARIQNPRKRAYVQNRAANLLRLKRIQPLQAKEQSVQQKTSRRKGKANA